MSALRAPRIPGPALPARDWQSPHHTSAARWERRLGHRTGGIGRIPMIGSDWGRAIGSLSGRRRSGDPPPPPPRAPPRRPPKLHLQNFARGPTGRTPRLPRRPPPAAPGSSCLCSPGTGRGALLRCSAVFTFAGPRGFSPSLAAAHARLCPALPTVSFIFLFFLEGHVHSWMRRESTPSCNNVCNPTLTRGRSCAYSCPRHH